MTGAGERKGGKKSQEKESERLSAAGFKGLLTSRAEVLV